MSTTNLATTVTNSHPDARYQMHFLSLELKEGLLLVQSHRLELYLLPYGDMAECSRVFNVVSGGFHEPQKILTRIRIPDWNLIRNKASLDHWYASC